MTRTHRSSLADQTAVAAVRAPNKNTPVVSYLHFGSPDDADGFLAPDYRARINFRGIVFGSAGHLLACLEARHYGDVTAEGRIRLATSPRGVLTAWNAIQRDAVLERAWQQQRAREVTFVQRLKFQQCPDLAPRLAATGDALLCYAMPGERVWGIGLEDTHPHACRPSCWPGQNLLGLALTVVRSELAGARDER